MKRTCIALLMLWTAGCQPDPWTHGRIHEEPVQQPLSMPAFSFYDSTLIPRQSFAVTARVLAVKQYRSETSHVMPFDVALGWKDMSEDEVLRDVKIWQGERRYYYQTTGKGATVSTVAHQSSNMHLIPSSSRIFEQLEDLKPHDKIELHGILVDVRFPWGTIRTSTQRKDMWDGACEIVWVTDLKVNPS